MRIAKVIGNVTLARCHPAIEGYRWIIGVPYGLHGLQNGVADGEDVIVLDQLGAGMDQQIGFSEGAEAAAPFAPEKKPVDAYCACILDSVTLARSQESGDRSQ